MKIKQLPSHLIDKIAAGEVVEKPASVVKELLENAIDAGATHIRVELDNGGTTRIMIGDNGCGIKKEEVKLAFSRHATSKIQSDEDLFSIRTMGFRGEALSSVSSVSKVTITTKTKDDFQGVRYVIHGGDEISFDEVSINDGSEITISDLFFNIPARKAFLKKNEYPYCLEVFEQISLTHLNIHFELTHNGKLQFELPPTDNLKSRLMHFFPKDTVESLIEIELESSYGKVSGLISPPGFEKSNSKSIFTYVNNRLVKDNVLRFAVTRGYHSHLLKGQYPVAIIFLNTDPNLIDVNVHPSKTEIRFQYGSEVQGLVASAIRNKLREGNWASINGVRPHFSTNTDLFSAQATPPSSNLSFSPPVSSTPARFEHIEAVPQHTPMPAQSIAQDEIAIPWQDLRYVGVMQKCFLIFDSHDSTLIADQHAFHERILFEQLRTNPKVLTAKQPLLVPEEISLSPSQIAELEERRETFENIQIEFIKTSERTIEVKALPQLLMGRDLEALFSELSNPIDPDISTAAEKLLATMACHAAVKAGDQLPETEVNQLLMSASNVDFYHNCPHGRRVFKWWSKYQIERWFDR